MYRYLYMFSCSYLRKPVLKLDTLAQKQNITVKWSFGAIQSHYIEASSNDVGIISKGSEDIANESSENNSFDHLTVV